MKRAAAYVTFVLIAPLCQQSLRPQEPEDRTLLSWSQMRAIINEVSGERAQHHVLELVPYPRVRERSEYEEKFRESLVVEKYAREYGFANVEVEKFPSGSTWHASKAELWLVEPESRKLYDVYDIAISICSGSESGDVTAEVVDVGPGNEPGDYSGKDVRGKVVLGSSGANQLQRLAIFDRGAVGVLSYNSLRPDDYPDEILSQNISDSPEKKPGFAWAISPRVAREIARRLAQGRKVTIRSIVQAESFPGRMETVHATIPGDGSTQQEVMVSAHLYEGYIKQGANDDNSGCGATLEMGRAYIRLVGEGKLPRPKRNIHFLWVPEISGTMAWLRKHEDTKKRLIADLNFDMEGLGLRAGYSQWVMHRTPDTFPTFLNDLCASVLEFVGQTNRERVRYRGTGYAFSLPILAPNGSRDPFYYIIDKHYGASDHVIYMNQGIPAILFITWPDMYYHSSQDTPDKLDSTQFKRASVVGAACMAIVAAAGDDTAAQVAAEALARGAERMGAAERKGLAYIADAAGPFALTGAYKEACTAILHQTRIERDVIRSATVLFVDPPAAERNLSSFEALIDQRANGLLNEAKAFYGLVASQKKSSASEPILTEAERLAARTVVERQGNSDGFGGGRRAQQAAMDSLSPEARAAVTAARNKIPGHMGAELNILTGKKLTVLEIRDFLSGEFEPLPLADLMDYLKAEEKLGSFKLVEKK